MHHTLATLVARYWWAIVLRGVVALLLGLMAFVLPGLTLAALVLLFGVFALVDGIAGIVLGFTEYGNHDRWWATLIGGLVSIAAGLVALFRPGVTAMALLLV